MAKVKGGNIKIEWYGFQEMLDKLEKMGADIDRVVMKALEESAKPIKKEILDFMREHSPGGSEASPWATGETLESWNDGIMKKKGDIITYKFGFSIRDGGLPSIFLNYGGFYNRPYLFLEKALDHNVDKIKATQEKALKELLKELGG